MYFDVLKTKTIEDCDTLTLLKCLSSIFSTKYHPKLCSTIRNNSFENLVEWLDNIVERKCNEKEYVTLKTLIYSKIISGKFNIPKSETIEIKPNVKKSDELECRHAAIGLIVDFSQFNGENQQQLLESFLSVEFNLANMIEFSFALETIHRILLEFEPSDELADFTMDIMKNVCRSYNKYEDICELLIDMYSGTMENFLIYFYETVLIIKLLNSIYTFHQRSTRFRKQFENNFGHISRLMCSEQIFYDFYH